MDWSGNAAWWAYQSVLGLLRGLSPRRALLHRPFPLAICLCPVSFPFLAPSFHLLLHLIFDSSFRTPSLVRSVSPLISLALGFCHHHNFCCFSGLLLCPLPWPLRALGSNPLIMDGRNILLVQERPPLNYSGLSHNSVEQ